MFRAGRVVAVVGASGGTKITTAVAQVVIVLHLAVILVIVSSSSHHRCHCHYKCNLVIIVIIAIKVVMDIIEAHIIVKNTIITIMIITTINHYGFKIPGPLQSSVPWSRYQGGGRRKKTSPSTLSKPGSTRVKNCFTLKGFPLLPHGMGT